MSSTPLPELVDTLFEAWSSGDPDAIGRHFHPDAVLWDSVNGAFHGLDAIRGLYVASLERWDDLTCRATRFWPPDERSIAFTWTMTGRVADDRFGPEHRGRMAEFSGMSYIAFEDGLVIEEIEYFDRCAPAASLGLAPTPLTFRPT